MKNPRVRELARERMKREWTEEKKAVFSSRMKEYTSRPEIRKLMSKYAKMHWSNPESVKQWREKHRQWRENYGECMLPNKPESLLINLFNKYSLPIRYTGNFSFWVTFKDGTHKNPDFKVNHKYGVIEFLGEYWHPKEDEELYKSSYNKIGYNCLIIWEHELEDENMLLKRIRVWLKSLGGN